MPATVLPKEAGLKSKSISVIDPNAT